MKAITSVPIAKLITSMAVVGMLIGAVAAQQMPEQYPGQHDHAMPPADYYCSGAPNTPADHKCACSNMPKDSKDPICQVYENQDDQKCSVYCHKEHCACKSSCPDT